MFILFSDEIVNARSIAKIYRQTHYFDNDRRDSPILSYQIGLMFTMSLDFDLVEKFSVIDQYQFDKRWAELKKLLCERSEFS